MCDEASAFGDTALLENGAWKKSNSCLTPDPHTHIHTHANTDTHAHTCPVHLALLLRYRDGK